MTLSLPIDALESQVEEALAHGHLVVQADTGSGKSTRLPLWARRGGRVLVVEPRRVACLALAHYLAEQQGTTPGGEIGYAIRFDGCYTPASDLVFVTPGIALRWFAEDGLAGFDRVMLDEFHERRWDTDLLLALLRARGHHRLLVTSATLEADRLGECLQACRLRAEGRCYPVSVEYEAGDSLAQPRLDLLEARLKQAVTQVLPRTEGDVLVFLPGRGEIRRCADALRECGVAVRVLHGSVPAAEQRRVLAPGERRRVILATNIAETSLTIPGVRVVIDSGLERRTHQRNGRTVLGLSRISRASAEQRRGRAGRVAPGICLRLWGEQAPLELTTPPEVLREELTEAVLAAACCGYPVDTLHFVDPLPEKALQQAREKLQRMGALTPGGEASGYGRQLYPLPIDSLFAHLISAMPDVDCRCATVDLVAALSGASRLFSLPKDEAGRRELARWQPRPCDATTLVALVRSEPPAELGTDGAARREARQLATQLRRALGLPALAEDKCPDAWLPALMQAAPELVFVRRQKRRQALGNGWSEVVVGRDSRFAEEAEAALVLDQYALPGKGVKQTLTIATCCAPLSLKHVAAAGLGTTRLANARYSSGCLEVDVERLYAGRVIATTTEEPDGPLAREALAALILEGRALAPAGARLQDDLRAWELYRSLQEQVEEPLVAKVWLQERLALLGVECGADLALLEPEDLAFEGIPEWERATFDATYPRALSLGDLKLAVHYEPRRKQVTLERLDGVRRGDPKRWELPKWRGWRVYYRQASRVVEIR